MEIFKTIKEAVEMGNEALEKEIKLQTLTGYPIDVLIDLFAKGYTLKCPEIISERSMKKMADRYKEGYNDCNRDWEKKIQEKIIEVKNRNVDNEFMNKTMGKLNTIIDLEDLLKKG